MMIFTAKTRGNLRGAARKRFSEMQRKVPRSYALSKRCLNFPKYKQRLMV